MSEGILTGEGVLLDARPASFATRLLAALLDIVVILAVVFAITIGFTAIMPSISESAARALMVIGIVTVIVILPTTVETLSRGRSLGKVAAGIRIVRDDGGPVRFRHSLVRALVGIGELWLTLGSVALITSMLNDKGKRVGDIVAGTYAVRVRGAQRTLAPVTMPYQLAGWARNADMRRLPDGLALAARQFLGRAATLHPASRARLGTELAAQAERHVAPPPPPGTHPETFLAAVLAERRDREYASATKAAGKAATEAALVHRLPHSIPDPD
ncbi:RDD family protein [Pengzhenrongella phosphoraccumulans]|uniref:RDD family protein n=1 Tax=Pengzhenrongella phosphoraccumulans TaxID=3114394 RepID=UPI00388D4EBD